MLGYAQPGGMASLAEAAPKLLFLLGADEVDLAPFAKSFKVYLGHHGDKGAHAADVILPGAAYTEKHGIHVNLEGRVQYSEKAVDPPGDAREDWSILRALSDVLGKPLPFDSFGELRARLFADHPRLRAAGLVSFDWAPPRLPAAKLAKGDGDHLSDPGFLPDQPDRPLLADAAALLGRTAARAGFCGGGGMSWQSRWSGASFPLPAGERAGVRGL